MRKTVYALGIRLLVENWPGRPLPERAGARQGGDPQQLPSRKQWSLDSVEAKLKDGLAHTGLMSKVDSLRPALMFAMALSDAVPDEQALRETYFALRRQYPGALPVPRSAELPASSLQALYFAAPERASALLSPVPISTGTGVAFDQALVEGATAFLIDRARADLASAGLELLADRIEDSPLSPALAQTLVVARGGRNRDPRLYLEALQAALATDFRELPRFAARSLSETGALGLTSYQWEVAAEAVTLVNDVQRGTHPLLALTRFADTSMSMGRDTTLRLRLAELGLLAGVLYAGQMELDRHVYRPHEMLRSMGARRLFLLCMEDELSELSTAHSGAVPDLEARVTTLLTTLEEIVAEVDDLREQFAQIRAASPDAAATRYAAYVAIVTRAVRHVLVQAGGEYADDARRTLAEVERVLAIREAVIRGDYAAAITTATPYLRLLGRALDPEEAGLIQAAIGVAQGSWTYPGAVGDSTLWVSATGRIEDEAIRLDNTIVERRNRVVDRNNKVAKILEDLGLDKTTTSEDLNDAMNETNIAWTSLQERTSKLRSYAKEASEMSKTERFKHDAVYPTLDSLGRIARPLLPYAIRVQRREAAFVRAVPPVLGAMAERAYRFEADAQDDAERLTELLQPTRHDSVVDLFVAAAAIASANDAEGVYDALVLFTAPPGSFADKRNAHSVRRSLAVNAYVGGIVGVELSGDDSYLHGGAFIPVGVEVSWSKPFGSPLGSLGLLVAPINLGTYADFGRSEPNYSLAQLFSPGAFLTVGIGRDLPLSAGAGFSLVPDLREDGNGDVKRFSIFAAVDLPLFIW